MSKNTQLGNLVNGLFVSSTRNVGVGTSTPVGKFNIVDGTNKSLIFQDSGVADTFEVAAYSASGGTRNLQINAANLLFGTGTAGGSSSAERMRITSAGNVGIGITAPSQQLSVEDTILIKDSGSSASQLIFGDAANDFAGRIFYNHGSDAMQFFVNADERMRITSGGNVGIATSTPDAKLTIVQSSAAAITTLYGSGNNQGSACNFKIVRHYPVVSSGNKLIIPFYSQGNLNSTTVVRIFGHSAIFNWNIPQAFTADFSVGHLNALYYLTTHNSTGNISGIAINGMNIEISFSSGYTNGTANGVYVTIEYMTGIPGYSIDIANIRMN